MNTKIKPLDIAEYLQSDEDIREYLKEVATSGNADELVSALNIAARAKGMGNVANKLGVSRTSLYKSLADGGNPQLSTISKVADVFGCKLVLS